MTWGAWGAGQMGLNLMLPDRTGVCQVGASVGAGEDRKQPGQVWGCPGRGASQSFFSQGWTQTWRGERRVQKTEPDSVAKVWSSELAACFPAV